MNENIINDENLPVQTSMDFPDALPLLMLTNQVVFPMALVPLQIVDKDEIMLIQDAEKGHRLVAMVALENGDSGKRRLSNAYGIGCIGRILQMETIPGSGLGVVNPYFIREIKRRLEVPIIVDAGVGTASHACVAMEQGVDGVLMNTALAAADDPVRMSHAMKHGVIAGRLAYLAGRMPSREIAVPSSPTTGMLD